LGGVVRGLESTPSKEVLQNFLGVNYLLRGVKPPDSPTNTACIQYTYHVVGLPCDDTDAAAHAVSLLILTLCDYKLNEYIYRAH